MKRTKQGIQFAVCVKNAGYEVSLEKGKFYRIVPDAAALSHGHMRVIDESGEDYEYSANRFFPLAVPQPLERALTRAR